VNSKCATEKQQKEFLYKLLGNKRIVTVLVYRGSEHGWMIKDFHERCDSKGPTVTLFKIKDGDCIGGYTKAKWSSDANYVRDNDAMLFNLSCCRHFPSKKTGWDIGCWDKYGPCFEGIGGSDLSGYYEPFNGDGKCVSHVNKSGYAIPVDGAGINLLTNKKTGWFTITELEVWEISNF
jgi:hypothetical protein